MLHFLFCAKLLLDPNSKISCLSVASFLGSRASEYLDCCPKMSKKHFFYWKFFKVSPVTKMFFFSLFKSENWRDRSKYYLLDQKPFCQILEYKKYFTLFNFKFYCCRLFFDILYEEGFCKFKKRRINFKVPGIFWKWKLCRACYVLVAKFADFFKLTYYKYPWSVETCSFSKIAKSAKSLHPNIQHVHAQ